MPNYQSRDEIQIDENSRGGAMEVLNMYGADNIVPKKVAPKEEKNDLLGGMLSDIMTSKKPHRSMVRSILQMKPKDIHLLKRSASYFLDNPQELKDEIDPELLEDLSLARNSNELADMIEEDANISGGELDGSTLIEGLASLLESVPKIPKEIVN